MNWSCLSWYSSSWRWSANKNPEGDSFGTRRQATGLGRILPCPVADLLSSGLYRRLWSLTRSAVQLAGSAPFTSAIPPIGNWPPTEGLTLPRRLSLIGLLSYYYEVYSSFRKMSTLRSDVEDWTVPADQQPISLAGAADPHSASHIGFFAYLARYAMSSTHLLHRVQHRLRATGVDHIELLVRE